MSLCGHYRMRFSRTCTYHISPPPMRSPWCLFFSAASSFCSECLFGFLDQTDPASAKNCRRISPIRALVRRRYSSRLLRREPNASITKLSSIASITSSPRRLRRHGASAKIGSVDSHAAPFRSLDKRSAGSFRLLHHCLSEGVTKCLCRIEARIEKFVRSLEHANQKHHLPVLHFPNSHLNLRNFTPADVPAEFLKLPRQIRL